MSWLTELFCPGLVRENAELRGRVEYYAGEADTFEQLAVRRGRNEQRMARDIVDRDKRLARQSAVITELRAQLAETQSSDGSKPRKGTRLGRALTACAAYRQQIAADARLIRQQQHRLDDALGLNDPDVLAGLNWQATRQDKRTGVQL